MRQYAIDNKHDAGLLADCLDRDFAHILARIRAKQARARHNARLAAQTGRQTGRHKRGILFLPGRETRKIAALPYRYARAAKAEKPQFCLPLITQPRLQTKRRRA